MLAAVALWLPLAFHNLPVAANVDERNGLVVLSHFHAGDANPHFFFYPTLYYYLDYAFTAAWGFGRELLAGRILNLALVGASAAASLYLAATATGSRLAGWCVGFLILTSPVFAASGSYLDTDVLLAWSTALSLAFFVRYFRQRATGDWLAAVCFCAVAFSCKYTALVLYFAYLLTELLTPDPSSADSTWLARTRLSTRLLLFCLLGVAALLFLAGSFFPVHRAVAFIQAHRTNVNTKDAASYLAFFHALRKKLFLAGAGLAVVALLLQRFPAFARKLAPARLYLGFVILVLVLLLTTPYSLVTPVRFVYDAASLLKNNVGAQGAHAQWGNYLSWFATSESWLAGVLALVGLVLGRQQFRRWGILYIYVALYFYVIGAAGRGFPRYLLALLPAFYCFSGLTLVWALRDRRALWFAAAASLFVVGWHSVHIAQLRRQAAATDEAYAAFSAVNRIHPKAVFFAGNAPSEELRREGYSVTELPWKRAASDQFWRDHTCQEVAVLDLHNPHPAEPLDVHAIEALASTWTHVAGDASPNSEDVYATAPCP